jgi:AraC family transcriptional regulator of adaptative response / DNA-3-methyladenine glycosylase II
MRKPHTLRENANATSHASIELDRQACYRVLQTRDARFDGRFYTAVLTTGIYCRPICPAKPPKIANCVFVPSAAAAHQMGFRPCLRCRPEVAPGVGSWNGSASTVSRALQLIAEGALDEVSLDQFAERLGVGARHLRRLFERHLGASPAAVAQTHRILFAKKLLNETSLPMAHVALASGFGSVRRFNDAFRKTYGRTPSMLRKSRHLEQPTPAGITLKLPFSPPYDWRSIIEFLRARAIPGVEQVDDDRYCRTFSVGRAQGVVEVRPVSQENCVQATIRTSDVTALGAVVARVRRVFDLDADIAAIDTHLSQHPMLARKVRERPGVRVPGAWDSFELAVRAMLGQQISVAAATTFAGRVTATYGSVLDERQAPMNDPDRLFPEPDALAHARLTSIGLTRARAHALQGLAAAMASDSHLLRSYETLQDTIQKLCALPGIGPWTAQYISMRALREPDAFPATDLGLMRATATDGGRQSPVRLLAMAEAWRPWRAYAAVRLWIQR